MVHRSAESVQRVGMAVTMLARSSGRGSRLATGLALALGLLWSGLAAGGDLSEISAADDASRPFVVKIHADWCGTCTRLNPVIDALEERVGSAARVVVLDVTDREAIERSAAEADRLRIRTFFEVHKSKTGTVGVLHGATRRPVRILRGEMDVAEYEAALVEAAEAS